MRKHLAKIIWQHEPNFASAVSFKTFSYYK